MLRLYTYFRSSASYRLRIALALKGLGYESVPVHLLKDGGEQHSPAYRAVNPAGLVPVLQDGGMSGWGMAPPNVLGWLVSAAAWIAFYGVTAAAIQRIARR